MAGLEEGWLVANWDLETRLLSQAEIPPRSICPLKFCGVPVLLQPPVLAF